MGMVSNTPWDVGARGTNQKMERTQAILTTMKLSLQEETGMLLSAAYKWLRKQLRIQNVDTVVSNMGAEIIEKWKKAWVIDPRPSAATHLFWKFLGTTEPPKPTYTHLSIRVIRHL
jgi:hypothetical protein